ncbi:hypothetical protein [Yersinia pseudotuberculosis]|uniref:Uncharacterized protein n=1 Tax=Yersinia pseudotuberculosis serotype O:3 (strain YPIII) TaxID=502800 RepID=A0A0H3B0Q8_YERPY|nr:hypothetical protein [Yersinia pseudotuberculosis]AIN14539.1 hypothetical protein DJ40_2794 [Yersinia pseudotuberculosis]AJJ06926.1 hypothetical protein BZ20_2495 [Yersinia pseudotuberculosis]AJJ58821.1 hypothetical protein BZ22_996 [Yersinia pseudotuberculosis YPIII]AXY35525.1 hypothetical protein CEQ20_20525 [Yersinia pseudotuberculosis]AYW86527.1 hypothetical protein EGX87_04445 [Yersinia pseudotuberculosis]
MTYDQELKLDCANSNIALIELGDAVDYFNSLEAKYSLKYNRVDFSLLDKHIHMKANGNDLATDYQSFIIGLFDSIKCYSDIIYIGDNLTESAYKLHLSFLIPFVSKIAEIPQSHYFFPDDYSWCLNFSFEDDMDFGFLV